MGERTTDTTVKLMVEQLEQSRAKKSRHHPELTAEDMFVVIGSNMFPSIRMPPGWESPWWASGRGCSVVWQSFGVQQS